jgi:flagellar basal body-associated protein FliL
MVSSAGNLCYLRIRLKKVALCIKNRVMATFIFVIVMLHLLAGFGYMVYKLSGKSKKD